MSIVDRLPELAERFPEEIKRLEHDKVVGEAAKEALWAANAITLERFAGTLPIRAILQELIDSNGLKFHGTKAEVIDEVTGNWHLDQSPEYSWFTEWTNRSSVICYIDVSLKASGAIEIYSVIKGKPTRHTWVRATSSSLHEYEEAIGFAYLEVC